MKRGILYLAAGEQFLDEARRSAKSVSRHMPHIDTAIATPDTNDDLSIFDYIIERESRTKKIDGREWLIDSTIPPKLSPFERTLYLDSDTYLCGDVSELFDILEDFNLAVARNPNKKSVEGLPDPWWQYNCGVMAFDNSKTMTTFLEDWEQRYRRQIQSLKSPVDQPAFLHTLYNSDVDFFTLPQEYNVRCNRRGALGREAKILHGRHPAGIEQIAKASVFS